MKVNPIIMAHSESAPSNFAAIIKWEWHFEKSKHPAPGISDERADYAA